MFVKDHEQKSFARVTIHNRRVRRCLGFTIVFICIVLLLLSLNRSPFPKPTELHFDTIAGLHKYTSSPEAGKPPLPFRDNAQRKASEVPFFDTGEYEDEDNEEEEDTVHSILKSLIEQKLVTKEQLKDIGPEGFLVGVH